jgi:hypothetical protein
MEDKGKVKKLTDSQKKTLLTQGYVIVDDRAANEKSTFGAVDYLKKFINPPESGFYSYVTKLGGLRYGLILVRPKQLQQDFGTDDVLVLDIESKNGTTYIKDHKQVFVKDQIRVQDYSAVHKMMVDAAELAKKLGTTVLLKGGHSQGTVLRDILVDNNGRALSVCTANRISDVDTHGSGCTLSAGLTARLARGEDLTEAFQNAHAYLQESLAASIQVGPRKQIGH